jgi:hypothetical protein
MNKLISCLNLSVNEQTTYLYLSINEQTTSLILSMNVCLFGGAYRPLSTIFQLYRAGIIGGGNRRTRRKPPTCRKSLTNFNLLLLSLLLFNPCLSLFSTLYPLTLPIHNPLSLPIPKPLSPINPSLLYPLTLFPTL